MKHLKNIIYLLVALTWNMGQAQSGKQKKAAQDYFDFAYSDAIEGYTRLVKDGYSDKEIYQKLGDANYKNAQYAEAVEWYKKLFELQPSTIESEYIYRYAQSLKSIEKYEESDRWMERFYAQKNTDQRAKKFDANRDYLSNIKNGSGKFTIALARFNSKVSDFAPSIYNDVVVFSSARDTGIVSRNVHEWDKGSFLDIYASKRDEGDSLQSIVKFSKNINRKTHESSTAFTKDGKTLYFTRNNSESGRRFSRDDKGVSRLKLMKAKLLNGEWQNIIELPFNADTHSVAHPTLNADETRLYFSSDMQGTLGNSDIFYVDILEDGSYGKPVNLGSAINTEARETFPFIAENGILYFASDGHPGLGGLDIFAVDLESEKQEVINLGEPVNSSKDDFSLVYDQDLKKGYFASNRDGGVGDDDIYSFVEDQSLEFECLTTITGTVKDLQDVTPLVGAKVIVKTSVGIAYEVFTDTNGKFILDLDCNEEEYSLVVKKNEYESITQILNFAKEKNGELVLHLSKVKVPRASIGTELTKHLDLAPIYFDLDKSNIRPDAQKTLNKVVAYLMEYPDTKISIESHTDAKSSKFYNQKLSERRAIATLDYLAVKGIERSRIISKGYGEEKLINQCRIWSECTSEENEINRRSELLVIK